MGHYFSRTLLICALVAFVWVALGSHLAFCGIDDELDKYDETDKKYHRLPPAFDPILVEPPHKDFPKTDDAYPYYVRQMAESLDAFEKKFKTYLQYTLNVYTPGYKRAKFGIRRDANGKIIPVHYIDLGASSIKPTNQALDLTTSHKRGLFSLLLPDGDEVYTYDGRFELNHEGMLKNIFGMPVLAIDGKPIYLPHSDVFINKKGEIYDGSDYIDTIKVTIFKSMEGMWSFQGTIFYIENKEKVTIDKDAYYTVLQGHIQTSNEDTAIGSLTLSTPWHTGVTRTAKEIFNSHDHLFRSTGPD